MSANFLLRSASPLDVPVVTRELVTREWCILHRLIDDLSAVQARLGTPVERMADYELVCGLGHNIRNKLHLMQLWAELGLMVEESEVLLERNAG